MKKQIWYVLLTALLCLTMVIGLAACGGESETTTADNGTTAAPGGDNSNTSDGDDDGTTAPKGDSSTTSPNGGSNTPNGGSSNGDGSNTSHTHTYATAWSKDETHHWHAATCEHSEEKSDYAVHTWGEGVVTTPATCIAGIMTYACDCGATKTEEILPLTDHTYSEEWSTNTTHHWHAATCTHRDEKANYAGHTYGADHICTVCGCQVVPTAGLQYTLNGDRTAYTVSDIDTATDTDIVIAATYQGLPVTSIGNYAFSGCSSLTSITIPDSVTSIGSSAFYNCENLTSITIPDGVTSIGENSFSGCTSLTSITIPDSVTSIGDYAFSDCMNLTSVTIPDSVISISIDSDAFSGCTKLIQTENGVSYLDKWVIDCDTSVTNVTLRSNTVSINASAFSGCTSLTSITIPDSVTSIGYSAFKGCTNLTSITIPFVGATKDGTSDTHFGYIFGASSYSNNSRYVPSSLQSVVITGGESIGKSAFYGCTNLTSITIPFVGATKDGTSNTHFGYIFGAPDYTDNSDYVPSSLRTVVITGGESIDEYAFRNCANLTSITLPNSVKSLGYYSFSNCEGLTSITLPNSITSIDTPFAGCFNLTSVHISDLAAWCNIQFSELPLTLSYDLYLNDVLVTELVIPNGVTSIASYAFEGCNSLTSVTIPDTVTSIGSYAFEWCSSLENLAIGNGVTTIGNKAFIYCPNLTHLTLGSDVTSIGADAFDSAYKLVEICNGSALDITTGSSDFGEIGYYALNIYTPTVGESKLHTTTDGYVFYADETNCYLIAYRGNETDLTLPATYEGRVYEIYQCAISNCAELTSIVIPSGVTNIGQSAFASCTNLTSITIPDSVTNIGDSAFAGCTNLTDITIPDGVTSIGQKTFQLCESLTSITIPDKITSIGFGAFHWCGLQSITIGSGVTSIDLGAFYECTSLNTVYYAGTAEEWDAISIDSTLNANSPLTSATRYYYSETEPTTSGNYWHYVEGVPTPW